jgi:hypothetical protein
MSCCRYDQVNETCSIRIAMEPGKESIMDAKYNWLIDNGAVRLTLNTVALAIWAALAVGLLELAARI